MANTGQGQTPPGTPNSGDLIEFYKEICTNIRATDDISFNILRSVPLVSAIGSGALVFLKGTEEFKNFPAWAIIGLSAFGALVTVGLLKWELRNVEKCRWLIARAAKIEERLREGLHLANDDLMPFSGMTHDGDDKAKKSSDIDVSSGRKWRERWGKTEAVKFIYALAILAWLIPVILAASGYPRGQDEQPLPSSLAEPANQ